MSSEEESLEQTYSDQLVDFESQLRHTMDDESLLQDVFRAIRELLKDHGESESDIRRILHDRFEAGQLREETFQVVQRMLDNIVADFVSTLPGSEARVDFADTDVIPPATLDVAPVERLQAGSVLRDRFLLQQEISGGSMGIVYKALDRRLAEVDQADPWVAIKVLTPKLSRNANALRAMQQEAAKGRCLAHPNIVRFIDLDREDDLYFLVMEWIEGRALAAVLDDPSSEPIDLGTSLEIVRQVGRALDYAHRCGVVHADVKPGNLMIMPDGTVKLIDFGVARIRQEQSKSKSEFDPAVLGAATPAYSSMQVLTGEDPVPADDVFSLACLLYRLLAGYRVFGPRNAAEAAEEGMVPQRPPGLEEHQWRALKKALAFSRVARYPSPKAFLDDLFGRTSRSTSVDDPEETIINAVEPHRTRRWPAVAGLLAVLGGGAYLGLQNGQFDTYLERAGELVAPAQESAPAEPLSAGADAVDPPSGDGSPDVPAEFTPQAPVDSMVGRETIPPEPEPEPMPDQTELVDLSLDQIFVDDSELDVVPADEDIVADDLTTDVVAVELDPTHTIALASAGQSPVELSLVLREDGASAIIELTRRTNLRIPLSLRVEEVGFSGNRSPWEAGQYVIANDGLLVFAAGQDKARTSLSMMSDPLREADRQVDLVVREVDAPDRELALISVTLEDDDQRNFESSMPANTIAFAVSQVSVAEADPAVQIDVLRFNPDSWPVDVNYVVQDVTATEGQDYFSPRVKTISFAPGQRTARLLIPLVQDSAPESDEAFFLEIDDPASASEGNIFRRIAVMIRDDDSQP